MAIPKVQVPDSHSVHTVEPGTPPVDSKEAVLDAAQRLINQYGYAGFSMRDLAQQSGLAKATLYHHFTDKREIFFQVLQRDLTIVRDELEAAATIEGDLATRLRSVTRAFFELAKARGLLLTATLRQAAGMEQEFCELMRTCRDQLNHPIMGLLQEAIADGSIRPIDVELTATSYFGILQVLVSRYLLLQDLELDEQTIDFVLDFTFHGLMHVPPQPAI